MKSGILAVFQKRVLTIRILVIPWQMLFHQANLNLGISICGTGNGINMVVNKHPGIRSALCWNEEISRLARAHNDANICALPGRFISESEAYLIVKTFLNTEFEGGRHRRRVDKILIKNVLNMLSNSCRYGIRAVIYIASQPIWRKQDRNKDR